jgi:hypothetical protein
MLGAALVLVAGVFLVRGMLGDDAVLGGSTLSRWLRRDTHVQRVVPADHAQQTPLVAPTTWALPSRLADELWTTGDGQSSANLIERFYGGPDGLVVRLTRERAATGNIVLPDDRAASEIVGVNGVDVLTLFAPDSRLVVGMIWAQGTTRYHLFIVQAPSGGLPLDRALAIVADLLAGGERGP